MINFSGTENISQLIELEKISLMSNLDIQKNLNKQILMFMKTFMANINFSYDTSPADENTSYLNELTSKLNTSNSNINILKTLLDILDTIDICSNNLELDLKNYNNNFKECFDCIYKNTDMIEKFLYQTTLADFLTNSIENNAEQPNTETENVQDNPSTVSNVSEITTPSDNTISEITTNESNVDSNSPFIENTLIISETRGVGILPYKLDKLNEILNTNTDKYD